MPSQQEIKYKELNPFFRETPCWRNVSKIKGFSFLKLLVMDYGKNLNIEDIKYFCEFDLVWKTEEWRPIKDYEGLYNVSDLGRIKSIIEGNSRKQKILKPFLSKYFCVGLTKNKISKNLYVHIIVAVAFLNHIPCGMKLVINHKNFIKTDNRKINLEITTQRKNTDKKHLKHNNKNTGVYKKYNGKFYALIWHIDRKIYLGTFDDESNAIKSYNDKLKEIMKEERF